MISQRNKNRFLILWLARVQSFINYEPQFETNSLLNRKPMQRFKHRGYMFIFGCISYGSSQRVLNCVITLPAFQSLEVQNDPTTQHRSRCSYRATLSRTELSPCSVRSAQYISLPVSVHYAQYLSLYLTVLLNIPLRVFTRSAQCMSPCTSSYCSVA